MARKITTSTDKSGRTVYTITGTKKYAFSLVKAKKIAASLDGASVRKPAKKTAAKKTARKTTRRPAKRTTALARVRKPAKRTTPKRNASGQFVKRTAAKKATRRNSGWYDQMQARRARNTAAGNKLAFASASETALAPVKRKKAKVPATRGITLAQTRTVARNIIVEHLGDSPSTAASKKMIERDVRKGVIKGTLGDIAAEMGIDEDMLPTAIRGKGYFDVDSAGRMVWEND